MSTTFLMSYFALWGLFLLQSLVILLVLRQVGVLHLRISPAGARVVASGPKIGQLAPAITLKDIADTAEELRMSPPLEKDVLLLFLSPNCAVCSSLMPAVKALVRESKEHLVWAAIGLGNLEQCKQFREKHGLNYLLFAFALQARDVWNVGPTPFAVLVRKDGIVIAKGVVNHMEHLESVLGPRIYIPEDNVKQVEVMPVVGGIQDAPKETLKPIFR